MSSVAASYKYYYKSENTTTLYVPKQDKQITLRLYFKSTIFDCEMEAETNELTRLVSSARERKKKILLNMMKRTHRALTEVGFPTSSMDGFLE